MPKQHMFVSNRDVMVSSTLGHSIQFLKGVPIHVPKIMHKEVIEKGILPVEGAETATEMLTEAEGGGVKIHLAPEDPDDREEAIGKACRALAERNNSRDFTGGGVPSATAVTAALGWKVDQKEVKDIWQKLRQEKKA